MKHIAKNYSDRILFACLCRSLWWKSYFCCYLDDNQNVPVNNWITIGRTCQITCTY